MRQVLIQESKDIKDLANDKIVLVSSKETLSEIKAGGVTLARFPLKMNVVAGGSVNIKFELSKQLAKSGALLLGAFFENEEVEAIFMSGSSNTIELRDGTPVLTGTLVETVRYRQVETVAGVKIVGGATDQTKTKKKKKKT